MVSEKALETGVFPITFDASISNGKYNWAWQMKRNGEVVRKALIWILRMEKFRHMKKDFFVNGINLDKGDTITLKCLMQTMTGRRSPRQPDIFSGQSFYCDGCSVPDLKSTAISHVLSVTFHRIIIGMFHSFKGDDFPSLFSE